MTVTATSIGLSWSAPAGGGAVTAYTVLWRVTGSGAFAVLADPVSGTSYTATGLVPTTSYDFAVFARNGAGPGGLSGIVTQATLGEVPYAPASFAAAAGSPAWSAVALSWAAPSTDSTHGPAASYTVSYSLNNTGSWTVAQSGITGTNAAVSGLSHDTLYGFKVDAVNSAGTNVSGATATLTTDYAPPNVPAIDNVAPVNDGTATKLAVAWSAPATDGTHDAATGYSLRYSVHAANSWTTVAGVSSGAVITGLSAGTSYDVQVQGTNGSATSPGAWSSSTTASTYSIALAWTGSYPPPSPWTHGATEIVQVAATPNPSGSAGVNFFFSASGTTNMNIEEWHAVSGDPYPIEGNVWGAYMTAPVTPGTYYAWAIVSDGSGTLVSSAITVT